ncbi:hypothetical protein FACS189429_1470 [Bacteroidia bacterium]|nr:hypothetical protein FACS189429_1470 [Bacteroidia bacterium]
MEKYTSKTKYQIAQAADVSLTTFNRWLKRDNIKLEKNVKILSPDVVKFLHEKYCIEF